jgi:hypothetical protein
MQELVFLVVKKPHWPLRTVRQDIPEGLAAVVDRCLQKSQADRFANVAELAKALAPFAPSRSAQSVERIDHLLGLTNTGSPRPAGPRAAAVPRPEGQTFLPTTSRGTTTRSHVVFLPVALAVVAALVGGFFALRPARRPATVPAATAPVAVPVAVPVATTATTEAAAAPSTSSSPPPSAETSSTVATAPSASVPWWFGKAPTVRPATSTHPGPSATCHVVSYFDADGNKHFKQACP